MIVQSTEFKTNLGRYLDKVEDEEIFILRNGKPVAKVVSCDRLSDAELLRENADAYDFRPKSVSYEEFIERYEQTEDRLEYIDGVVYALASPSFAHQKTAMVFANNLYNFLSGKKCQAYMAPLDVHFESKEPKACVQPDILVICDEENIRDGMYYGIPRVVVEVVSPSSRSKDMITKLNLYWNQGVEEFLLIDPVRKTLNYWHFKDGEISEDGLLGIDDVFTSRALEGFEIALKEIFQ